MPRAYGTRKPQDGLNAGLKARSTESLLEPANGYHDRASPASLRSDTPTAYVSTARDYPARKVSLLIASGGLAGEAMCPGSTSRKAHSIRSTELRIISTDSVGFSAAEA